MSAPVRSYRLFSSLLLKAEASVVGGRLQIRASGPLFHLPAARASLNLINGQIPASSGDRLYISTWMPPVPSEAFRRLAWSQIRSAAGVRTPDQITISITEECPNACVHCALPDSGRRLRLEPSQVMNIIEQALDLGTTLVIFDGGEPALYRELPDLVAGADDRAIKTVFTSGAGFTRKLAAELKEAGLQAVNISLDSPIEADHDLMRGRKGAYRDAIRAAELSLEAGLLVDIYAVLRHENVHQLPGFHRLAGDLGAHELTLFEVVPTGRFAGFVDSVLTGDDRLFVDKFVADAGAPRIFSVPDALRRFGCFAARSWLHVTPTGDVYPCACLPEVYGNVLKEPLSAIWKRMRVFPHRGSRICPARIR